MTNPGEALRSRRHVDDGSETTNEQSADIAGGQRDGVESSIGDAIRGVSSPGVANADIIEVRIYEVMISSMRNMSAK